MFVHLQQFHVQYVIMFTVYRAYLSYLVYTYLFILISTASCSILLVRNETSYLSIVFDFLSYSLKSVGRLFPVHLDLSSLKLSEFLWSVSPVSCLLHPIV